MVCLVFPLHSPDGYECTGNVEIDFPVLSTLLNMKNIPEICSKQPDFCTTETKGEDTGKQELLLFYSEQRSISSFSIEKSKSHKENCCGLFAFLNNLSSCFSIISSPDNNQSQINPSPVWSKPRINVELENEDPPSAKMMKISGKKQNTNN